MFKLTGSFLIPLFFASLLGRDRNAYYHEYFLRGRSPLCQKIVRTKVKGRGARKASSPETEPRLYELPWMEEARSTTTNQQQSNETPLQNKNPTPSKTGAAAQTIDPVLVALAAGAPASTVPTLAAAASNPAFLTASLALLHRPTSLGDALGFLTYSQALQTAHIMAAGAYHLQNVPAAQGEMLLLPAITPEGAGSNASSAAMLNSLLASLGSNPLPSARTSSMLSSFVPIAPAPPRQVHHAGQYKLWEHADATGRTAENAYSTVLAALKAQHHCSTASAPAAASNHDTGTNEGVFTRPGPAPF
jgi:hypothetical protein